MTKRLSVQSNIFWTIFLIGSTKHVCVVQRVADVCGAAVFSSALLCSLILYSDNSCIWWHCFEVQNSTTELSCLQQLASTILLEVSPSFFHQWTWKILKMCVLECSGVFSLMSVIHHQLKSLVKSWVEMSWKCFFRTLRGHTQRLSTNQELSWDIIDQWEADSWRSSVSDTLIVETCPDRIIEGEIILIICDLG